MNHPYPDNYHGGYTRGGPAGMQHQGMGYGHGGYDNPASMARMGHPRHAYNQMPQHYGEGGQMHPMMQHHLHPNRGGGMYSPHGGGYMNQMGGGGGNGGGHYGMMGPAANYPGYNGMLSGGMNHSHPGMSHMAPGRGHQQHPGNSMMSGSGGGYYNNHHAAPHSQQQHHQQHQHHHSNQQQHAVANQLVSSQPTPPPNYGHQSPSTNNSMPNSNPNPVPYIQQTPNQNPTSQATHHHHPSPHTNNASMQGINTNTNHAIASPPSSSIPPTTTPTHNMPITTQAAINNVSSNIQGQGQQQQQQQQMASMQNNTNMMMANSHNSQQTLPHGHSQPRPPVTGAISMPMSVSGSGGGGGGGNGSTHPIPQHPMRHPTTQQSPQEVADNILQIASSYPTNQTVQVPLKGQGRHAPYHIPRSPHHFNASSASSPSSTSTSTPSSSMPSSDNITTAVASNAAATTNHFLQQQHPSVASPPAASSSQQSQPNMSPSTSSSVKSPNPALAPIPNPIPSPGISGIRSPSSTHCLSPCSSQQRSPGHMASSLSSYSGHNQPAPSPSSSQHYSPISGGGTPQHLSASYAHSPPSYHSTSNNQANISHSPADNQSMYGSYSNMNHQQSSSPYAGNLMTSSSHTNIPSGGHFNQHHHQHQQQQHPSQQCIGNSGNNPLMSLQKLVMLPETQVVDPKSVVNDACLAAASANESNVNTDSKNCEGPAERFAESSGLSVGSSGQSSSLNSDACQMNDPVVLPSDCNKSQVVNPTAVFSSSPNGDTPTTSTTTADDVVDGEVKDTNSTDAVNETNSIIFTADSIAQQNEEVDERSDLHVLEDVTGGKIMESGDEKASCPHDNLLLSLNSNIEERDRSAKNDDDLLQESLFTTANSCGNHQYTSGDESENQNKKEEHGDVKHLDTSKLVSDNLNIKSSDDNSSMLDAVASEMQKASFEEDEEDPIKKNENLSCFKKSDSLSPVKKDEVDCELKQSSPESKSPSVLSEVQVVANGNHAASNTEEDEEEIEDEENKKITRARLRNGLKSVVRSKLGKTSKKSSQFLRLTTPCSISVGADEREVCEQFAFRRNGYCHALRASRLLYNGRARQDSTSHGDSDESVENVSDASFHSIGTPQDGSKKKNVAKKNDGKQSNSSSNQPKANGKESFVSKGGENTNSRHSNISKSNNSLESGIGGSDNIHEKKDLSDEEGDLCYYEGVDSTDFFTNNNSSDDSFSSSPDSKQKKQETKPAEVSHEKLSPNIKNCDNQQKKETEAGPKDDSSGSSSVTSLPAKRQRKPPAQRDNTNKSDIDDSKITHVLLNGTDNDSVDIGKEVHLSNKVIENSSGGENGKVAKTRLNRRKQVFDNIRVPEEQMALPNVLVKLENSELLESSKAIYNKIDVINLIDSPPKEEMDSGITEKSKETDDVIVISESSDIVQKIKIENVKTEGEESITENKCHLSPSKSKGMPNKRRRQTAKNKQKGNNSVLRDKEEDVRDSFKSMKFGRTLDMMKSHRKKDQNSIGPFIRVIGSRTEPKKVSVINQSAQNVTAATSGKQNQKPSSKHSVTSTAAIRMVSNLSSDKSALVTSSKTVSYQMWACAFCNHQSSFHSLGDLFGPYYKEEDIPEVEHLATEEAKRAKENEKKGDKKNQFSPSLLKCEKKGKSTSKAEKKGQTPSKAEKKGPLTPAVLPSSSKKRKLSGGKQEEGPQEIWVHQACALWAPGVYIIGNKLYGMDEAMKDAADSMCSSCKVKGAMVGCLHKGCAMKYHISCAIDTDCCLDEENLSLLCPKHKDKKMRISAASISTFPFS